MPARKKTVTLEQIFEKLTDHDRRFDDHDQQFAKIFEKLDNHDRQFANLAKQLFGFEDLFRKKSNDSTNASTIFSATLRSSMVILKNFTRNTLRLRPL